MYGNKRIFYFSLAILIALIVSFIKYDSLNLYSAGHWQLDFIRYQDKARFEDWGKLIHQENDQFVTEKYGDKDKLIKDLYYLYSYDKLLPYFFYNIFNLKGAQLWLAQKLAMTCLGICSVILIFLIADLFYGPLVGFLASIFFTFSPHIWIAFNFDGGVTRAYNLLFSLLLIYLFLKSLRRRSWYVIILSGIVMGVNFLFFHIGSFMIPIIIFVYYIYHSFLEKKKFYYLGYFLLILLIAALSSLALNYLHCSYFKIPITLPYTWFEEYFSRGPIASHSVDGLVFLNYHRLFLNIKEHIWGVFVNGRTSGDWHYIISPPGIPYVYNYLIALFFIVGCVSAIRVRKKESIFFLLWFFTFFVIYSLVVVVRHKNILWEVPAIFILAAHGLPSLASFLGKRIRTISEKKLIVALVIILVATSMTLGSFSIFCKLPKRNFYDGGSYLGTYQIYQFLLKQGYSENTKIIFTLSNDIIVGNMMLRLFTERVPRIICLSHLGLLPPPKETDWQKAEIDLLKDSDKIFYAFTYHDNSMGVIYYSDEFYRQVFKRLHPEIKPFIINGLNGNPLWRIYKVEPKK